MKRYIVSAALAAVLLAAASCGNGNGGNGAGGKQPAERIVTQEMQMDNEIVSEAIRRLYASGIEGRSEFQGTERWNEYTSKLCYDPITQSQDPQPQEVLVSRADAPDNAFDVKWRAFGKNNHIILVFAVENDVWKLDNIIEDVDKGNTEPMIDYSRPASDYDDFPETSEE